MDDATPMVFALPLDGFPSMTDALGADLSPEEPGWTLARALASSPIWKEMGEATIVVRSDPAVLGLFGRFDDRARARLEALPWQLRTELPRLRYVGYRRVEDDCEELATRLIEALGRDAVLDSDFVAIPRGGMIVLGMLGYFLDLRPSQLAGTASPHRPRTVVVDDCSLSGVRFGQFLAQLPDRPIVFATLYSHPDLRNAIEAREPRVEAVVSARDLRDHAPALLGPDYPAWKERWATRSGGEGYWIGHPERVCFPWNETDVGFWNPIAERGEVGWRLVPPELCLKNRVAAAAPRAPRIQVQPRTDHPLSTAPTTLFAKLPDCTVVANYRTGEVVRLTDVAAEMWHRIVEEGDPGRVVATLLDEYEVEEDVLKRDLSALIEEMERRGFLAFVERSKTR